MPKLLHFIQVMAWNATHNPDFQAINFFYGFHAGFCDIQGVKSFCITIPVESTGFFWGLEWQYEKTKDLSYEDRLEWFDGLPF